MNADLKKLLKAAKSVEMSPEDKEEQRRSFAYGNTKIENDRITRDMIDRAADKIPRKKSER